MHNFAHLRAARRSNLHRPAPPAVNWLDAFHAAETADARATKHKRIRREHRHLHMTTDLRARATGRREMAPAVDPELARIVSLCRRAMNARTRREAPLPANEQSRAWTAARDAYAAKNYDLCYRAAAKQWERNRHLEREIVPCVFCPGRACSRCRGRRQYRCQPDLERLAFVGLLEAIRLFDADKAHCISSYAVHTMKHSMMNLLRQTPVFYPQDLLRDRRVIAALRKRLNADTSLAATRREVNCRRHLVEHTLLEPTEEQAVEALIAHYETAKRKPLSKLDLSRMPERARLALNCYYGNEHGSVEELHERYIQRTDRGEDKRQRRSRVGAIVEVMCCEQPRVEPGDESEELRAAIRELPDEVRSEVDRHLRGRGDLSATTMSALRDAIL